MNMRCRSFLLVILLALLTAACGGGKKPVRAKTPPPPQPQASSQPRELEAYADNKPVMVETGIASWYGPPYHNRKAANGEIYDMNAQTAAHKTLPMGSVLRVTNVATGRSTLVRINDRGPFIGERIIDLSLAAAKQIDVWRAGIAKVKVEVLYAPKPIDEGGRWLVQAGAFSSYENAVEYKEKLARRYKTAKIQQFTGPTGEWVRIRVLEDDRKRAYEVANANEPDEGGVFVVRLD
jgi:rare lipoprotein A